MNESQTNPKPPAPTKNESQTNPKPPAKPKNESQANPKPPATPKNSTKPNNATKPKPPYPFKDGSKTKPAETATSKLATLVKGDVIENAEISTEKQDTTKKPADDTNVKSERKGSRDGQKKKLPKENN